MPELRWILLLVGVGVVAGIYLWNRRSANAQDYPKPVVPGRTEPEITDPAISEPKISEPLVVIPAATPEPTDESEPKKQKIISLRIATRANDQLNGVEVVKALKQCGLEHGQYKIFHRFSDGSQRELMFSVASLVEPGSFNLDTLEDMNLPGLSVFMILPGPTDAVSAFSEMLVAARRLAEKLNCELLDDTGSTLSAQAASYLREDIIRFQHQLGLKH